jgi:archaellum component FlaC
MKYRSFLELGDTMSIENKTNADTPLNGGVESATDMNTRYETLEDAELEIARLKQELTKAHEQLAEAHEELENLSEATSGFVRLMI